MKLVVFEMSEVPALTRNSVFRFRIFCSPHGA